MLHNTSVRQDLGYCTLLTEYPHSPVIKRYRILLPKLPANGTDTVCMHIQCWSEMHQWYNSGVGTKSTLRGRGKAQMAKARNPKCWARPSGSKRGGLPLLSDSPPGRDTRERCELPQWGLWRIPGRQYFMVHFGFFRLAVLQSCYAKVCVCMPPIL